MTFVSRKFLAAVVGGYIYGYSPFVVGHLLGGHLELTFQPWIPLAAYITLRFINQTVGRVSFVALLTLVAVLQFLTSTETFATATLMGALTLMATLLLLRSETHSLAGVVLPLTAAAIATAVVTSPYLYYVLAFPEHPLAAGWALNSGYRVLFKPPDFVWLSYNQLAAAVQHKTFDLAIGKPNRFEGGMYLGPVLPFVLGAFASSRRHEPTARLLLIVLATAWLLSLGAYRQVGPFTFPLPWRLFSTLPLIRNVIPVRFTLYCYLVVGMITAAFIDKVKSKWRSCVAAILSVAFIVPALPSVNQAISTVDTPEFFATDIYRKYLRPDEIVLVLPNLWLTNSMLWQAQDGMYYRMAGGWTGGIPARFEPTEMSKLLVPERALTPELLQRLAVFISECKVSDVVVTASAGDKWSGLSRTLGVDPIPVGGVLLYRLPQRLSSDDTGVKGAGAP